jgi:hypothetical protein
MPTFKTNKTKRSGTIVQADNSPNDYMFASVGKDKNGFAELHHLDGATSKIIIDNQNMLINCSNGWTKLSVANVKEDETWNGWESYFKKAVEFTNKLIGYDDKNEKFVTAFNEESGEFIMAYGSEIISVSDEDLTMAVIQRNSPGTARFDVSWAFHGENKVITSVFDKTDLECVMTYLSDVTDNVYDAGPDPYDWKRFLKVQTKDGGDVNDWRGVFAPLTDEECDDDDDDYVGTECGDESEEEVVSEEEDEEEFDCDESETDESGSDIGLESETDEESDDREGADGYESDEADYCPPVIKRRRL